MNIDQMLKINTKELTDKELDDLIELSSKKTDEECFQIGMEYNIQDVEIIDQLEDQLKYIELVLAMAYMAKINYTDTLGTVLQWDIIIHNFLMERNTVVSPQKRSSAVSISGGYVKEPVPGMYKWVVSLDLNSLYPSLIQQYNISPDTYINNNELDNLIFEIEEECKKRNLIL